MKRFITFVLCVSVFLVGLGAHVENAAAKFKSDEKALELIRKARTAVGGDAAIAEVRGMIIVGKTTNTFDIHGATQTEEGETEIALQLPDRMSKTVRIGKDDGNLQNKVTSNRHDIVILKSGQPITGIDADEFLSHDGKRVIVRRDARREIERFRKETGDTEFAKTDERKVEVRKKNDSSASGTVHDKLALRSQGELIATGASRGAVFEKSIVPEYDGPHHNEMLRITISLLLSAPEGVDMAYAFAGEGEVDGTPVDIVNAEFAGSSFNLHLSKASSLPVMVSYLDSRTPQVFRMRKEAKVGEVEKETTAFVRTTKAPQTAEYQVRFSNYGSVNGVQLPFRWTTSIAGQTAEVFDVTSYEINPANLADKFRHQNVLRRMKKNGN